MTSAIQIELSNPFPGLRPFREGEEHLFFGRESQVDTMIDKLARNRFLAVVGTSGTGKSSLVNCGLRPALHRGLMATAGSCWRMAQFRPGSSPLKSMAQALAKNGVLFSGFASQGLPLEDMIETTLRLSNLGLVDIYEQAQLGPDVNLLVIADQFEELFRYRSVRLSQAAEGQDRSQEASMFVNLLLEAKAQTDFPIYIVVTLRSDFLGDCAEFTGLPEAINEGQYLVPRMAREERRAAIAGPVKVAGGKISPVLLTRLVNDVGDNPDQLSILQHALNRTWARWQHEGHSEGELALTHYEAIGTMSRALDQHAEKAYSELGSEQQRKICEKVFKALTDKSTDPRGVRRPTCFSALCASTGATPAELTEVIDVFRKPSRSFLMPPLPEALESETVIDISHESLMRVWERLKSWADEEAQSAQLFLRLVQTAALHGQGKAGLYRDPDLSLALEWREREHPTEAWASLYSREFELAMNFLASSEAQRNKEEQDAEERQRRELEQAKALATAVEQARSAKRLRRLTIALTVTSIIAVLLAIVAGRQTSVAEQQRQKAHSERLAEAAVYNADHDPKLGIRLAIEAAKETYLPYKFLIPDAEDALRYAMYGLRSQQGAIRLRQALSRVISFRSDSKQLEILNVSPSGKDMSVSIWDFVSKKLNPPVLLTDVGQGGIRAVTLSPDGKYLAAVTQDKYVRLWSVSSGSLLRTMEHTAPVTTIAFTHHGNYLITGAENKALVWEITTGTQIASLPHDSRVTALAASPDEKQLATFTQPAPNRKTDTGGHSPVTLWSDFTGKKPQGTRMNTVTEPISGISFLDEKRVAMIASGSAVIIQDVTASGPQFRIPDQQDQRVTIRTFALNLKGDRMATVGSDNRILVWNTLTGDKLFELPNDMGDIDSIAFSPDRQRLAAASGSSGNVRIWSMLPSSNLLDLVGHGDVIYRVAFSADGRQFATASWDKTAKLWDAATGKNLRTLNGHAGQVMGVAFSPDGKRVATASVDKAAIIWDAATGNELHTLKHTDQVKAVAFSPDGTRLATAGWDKTIRIWDARSGKEIRSLPDPSKPGHLDHVEDVAFSPDGKWVASASSDRTARVWEASTGQLRSTLKHTNWVLGVAFSPDSNRLATVSTDGTGIIWEIPSGKPKTSLKGRAGMVRSVVFSPDARWVAAASEDNSARIWDTASGRLLSTFSDHKDKVYGIAFSPDGSRLATVGADGKVFVYAWGGEETMELAEKKVKRPLTFGECQRYKVESLDCENLRHRAAARELIDLGATQARSGDMNSAVKTFNQAKNLDSAWIKLDPETYAKKLYAGALVTEGENQARSGDMGRAIEAFHKAKKLDPKSINLDPEAQAKRLYAQALIDLGNTQAQSGDMNSAIKTFNQAKEVDSAWIKFDPQTHAKELYAQTRFTEGEKQALSGDVEGAMATFRNAKELDPTIKIDPKAEANKKYAGQLVADADSLMRNDKFREAKVIYSRAISIYQRVPTSDPDRSLRASAWNGLCWGGSVRGHALEVIHACEQAVREAEQLQPLLWNTRDSRGLARALTGNKVGAVEDFQFFVAHTSEPALKSERQKWIAALRAGQQPFTSEVLKSIRDQ